MVISAEVQTLVRNVFGAGKSAKATDMVTTYSINSCKHYKRGLVAHNTVNLSLHARLGYVYVLETLTISISGSRANISVSD